ncbi:uncharacterized protein LOC115054802 [Echeneis naucrates]|uniref:uncharacterized protein LOC115054802 n=1 Tax=Echeneis naucrates TaxID=173247 RepID=UPI001113F1DB|nr:uncharacterized protein LOC115054802 [Echeneis naucrates]
MLSNFLQSVNLAVQLEEAVGQFLVSQWLNMLKKVKTSLSSALSPCKRHQVPSPHISQSVHDLLPEQTLDKDSATPSVTDRETSSPVTCLNPTGQSSPRTKYNKGSVHSVGCLRHGSIPNAEAVRAVYLLMGGAAASSAMGYVGACSSSNLEAKAPNLPINTDISGTYHTCSPALEAPNFNSFDFEVADSDFDGFDCGGFTF